MNYLSKGTFTVAVLLLSFLLLFNGASDVLAQCTVKHQVVKVLPQKHSTNHLNAVLPTISEKMTAYKQAVAVNKTTTVKAIPTDIQRISKEMLQYPATTTVATPKNQVRSKAQTTKTTNVQRISKEVFKQQLTTTSPQKCQAFQKTQLTKSAIILHK